MKWREEILNYFKTGLTNARVEGYNNVAKSVKKRAYGYKSFKNYRLRLLDVWLYHKTGGIKVLRYNCFAQQF